MILHFCIRQYPIEYFNTYNDVCFAIHLIVIFISLYEIDIFCLHMIMLVFFLLLCCFFLSFFLLDLPFFHIDIDEAELSSSKCGLTGASGFDRLFSEVGVHICFSCIVEPSGDPPLSPLALVSSIPLDLQAMIE